MKCTYYLKVLHPFVRNAFSANKSQMTLTMFDRGKVLKINNMIH